MDSSILFQLRLLHNSLSKCVQAQISKAGEETRPLNHVQGYVMGILYERRDQTVMQGDLEAELKVASSTVANILISMEDRGLVVRHALPADRRHKSVALTPLGIRSHELFIHEKQELDQKILDGVSEQEEEAFSRVLAKLLQNTEKILEDKKE